MPRMQLLLQNPLRQRLLLQSLRWQQKLRQKLPLSKQKLPH